MGVKKWIQAPQNEAAFTTFSCDTLVTIPLRAFSGFGRSRSDGSLRLWVRYTSCFFGAFFFPCRVLRPSGINIETGTTVSTGAGQSRDRQICTAFLLFKIENKKHSCLDYG